MRIPQLVADRIIANRQHFHDLNAQAQQRQRERAGQKSNLFEKIGKMTGEEIEVVSYGFQTKPLDLDREWQFWSIEDDEELDDFLSYDLLSALYGELSDAQWRTLPAGYPPLILVLEFERHSQFEGWTAVENRADELPAIIDAYRFVGLGDEAKALTAVADAYRVAASDDPKVLDEVLGRAYASVPNTMSDCEDRATHLLAFVRSHPELFAIQE